MILGGDSTQYNAMQLNHVQANCKQPYDVQPGIVQLDCVQWNIRGRRAYILTGRYMQKGVQGGSRSWHTSNIAT